MNTQFSLQQVINDAQKLKKELGMEWMQVDSKLLEGGAEWLSILMASKEKAENHQSKYLISAEMEQSKYNWKVLELRLRAELLEKQQ
jgi:hypothetical protein